MSSTQHSNHKKDQENGGIPSFSFSYDKDPQEVDPQALLKKVWNSLQDILNSEHSQYQKREILKKPGRWNFACPYCGDSATDYIKKRGNIYTEKMYFKCYNCGKYSDVKKFLKDFRKDGGLSTEEELFIKDAEKSDKKESKKLDPSILFDIERLKKYAIDRKIIEKRFYLKRAEDTPIITYLEKRSQPNIDLFSWNQEKQQLYIFHMLPNTELVIGFQIRNFISSPKYMTYRLSRIYELLKMNVDKEVEEIDEISTIFGILSIDISKPITVFEGPLDSFLYKNSIATCSTNIDVPIEISTLRYLYDYDKAGRDESIKKLQEGKHVFLWKKFFKESGIDVPVNKKVDLTDIVTIVKRKNLNIPKIANFFSNDKYDAYWL